MQMHDTNIVGDRDYILNFGIGQTPISVEVIKRRPKAFVVRCYHNAISKTKRVGDLMH